MMTMLLLEELLGDELEQHGEPRVVSAERLNGRSVVLYVSFVSMLTGTGRRVTRTFILLVLIGVHRVAN
jgi:hypothetical protein